MTEKLYYENLYSREFDAEITSIQGNNITLDRTLFYPSGGGQPCDTGFIDNIEVLDVHEKNGEIIHVLAEPISEYKQVHGVINWDKRFELMQQHLGEHIFAGELYNLHGLHTARMRIEGDNVSIDVDTPVSEKIILEAESLANDSRHILAVAEALRRRERLVEARVAGGELRGGRRAVRDGREADAGDLELAAFASEFNSVGVR